MNGSAHFYLPSCSLFFMCVQNGLEDDDEFAHDGRFALSADELDDEYIAAPVADDVISGLAADELDEQTTRDKAECKELEWDDSTLSY
jgi:hypothetical protein